MVTIPALYAVICPCQGDFSFLESVLKALSGFTDDSRALLAGVSAGGCGTLVASMASLISYKLYALSGGDRKRYLLTFTAINLFFLALMTAAHLAASTR